MSKMMMMTMMMFGLGWYLCLIPAWLEVEVYTMLITLRYMTHDNNCSRKSTLAPRGKNVKVFFICFFIQ